MMVFSVLLKMLVYFFGLQFTMYDHIVRFGNVFILMSGVFFGIRLFKKQEVEKTIFLQDVKAGMRIAALYAIFMTAFIYSYYAFIDVNYFNLRLDQQMAAFEGSEQEAKKAREMGEFVLSAFSQSTVTLIGFLLLGSFYSAIITFLVRKFSFER